MSEANQTATDHDTYGHTKRLIDCTAIYPKLYEETHPNNKDYDPNFAQ